MKTSDFDYELQPEHIAQRPIEPRDAARLFVLERASGERQHRHFHDIGDYLNPGDLLVVNRSRVIPARLFVRKLPGGGKAELLLLERVEPCLWRCLVGGKGMSVGRQVILENGVKAEIVEDLTGPQRLARFEQPLGGQLAELGEMPLPPYIHHRLDDDERYQTVYAREAGSAAAPTAGLHFTPRLIEELKDKGILFAELTLHIGLDTFAPVDEDDPAEHQIHTEWCSLDQETADQINRVRQAGGRVIAVGTTSVRTLESAARNSDGEQLLHFKGRTDIFITPGYEFQLVDAMITNFHLPRSTLLMLVSAFAGREEMLSCYQEALSKGYRFYSFGDAMLLL